MPPHPRSRSAGPLLSWSAPEGQTGDRRHRTGTRPPTRLCPLTGTPTYSGCPAMDAIALDIKLKLSEAGFRNVKVISILSPAWTTDWMSEAGKRKLKEFGIAPPNPKQQVCNNDLFAPHEAVQCPHCDSYHTHRVSEFGSTACKALYQCDDCKEPFDYFKCH